MIGVINSVINSIAKVIGFFLNLLPNSPFVWELDFDGTFFRFISWLIPIQAIVTVLYLYCTAVVTYYCVRVVLRWIKAVGS